MVFVSTEYIKPLPYNSFYIRRWLSIYAIYLDVLFLENFLLDLSCLLAVSVWRRYRVCRWRLFFAAGAGCLAGILALLYVRSFWVYLLVLFGLVNPLMILLAFPYQGKKAWLGNYLGALLCSLLLGGLIGFFRQMLPEHMTRVMLPLGCTAQICVVFFLGREKKQKQSIAEVSCMVEGEARRLLALKDTGNCLLDAVTGLPVCILSEAYIKRWGLHEEEMRRIPYETLSGKGELLIYRPTLFLIREGDSYIPQKNTLLGFGKSGLFQGKDYQMILHRNFC